MKVLIVCSGNNGYISPFILEQADSLNRLGVSTDFFLIKGKGWLGYLLNFPALTRKIKSYNPSIIHAHYGLSGLLANLQFKVPVITTYHGSDLNEARYRYLSILSTFLSNYNVFVSNQLQNRTFKRSNGSIIPCGVDLNLFHPIEKSSAKELMNIPKGEKIILFSSSFDNQIKNYPLAKRSCECLDKDVELYELNNYTREQVNLLMNASELVLMTSLHEGSPQIIKEAMACNCPIVTTKVGDVNLVLSNTPGCFITSFETDDIYAKIKLAIKFRNESGFTNGRERLIELGLDSETIAGKIVHVYKKMLND
jgi:teichuronic acid biosynthesis glycosyltransferase TuaC